MALSASELQLCQENLTGLNRPGTLKPCWEAAAYGLRRATTGSAGAKANGSCLSPLSPRRSARCGPSSPTGATMRSSWCCSISTTVWTGRCRPSWKVLWPPARPGTSLLLGLTGVCSAWGQGRDKSSVDKEGLILNDRNPCAQNRSVPSLGGCWADFEPGSRTLPWGCRH